MIDLTSRVAIVTGGAAGIGRAIALTLAAHGAAVGIADLDADGAAETVRLIQEAGGQGMSGRVDIADIGDVQAFRDQVRSALGTTSVVVNNAGWDRMMPFLETTPEFWRRVVGVNYLGPLGVTHTFVGDMVTEGVQGHVVTIASDAGRVGSTGEAVYAGAKGGVIAFTKSLAREVARHGINANCVAPGPTDTELFNHQPEKLRAALLRAVPMRRVAQPEDVANAVTFLASDEASYITGQVLSVSGGLTMVG